MNTVVYPSALFGNIQAIASKSFVHRALIAAALSASPSVIEGRITGKDAEATVRCLTALGAKIEAGEGFLRVSPINGQPADHAVLDCGESGSTLRFMLPVAAALGVSCTVTGGGRLGERPVAGLINALNGRGAIIKGDSLPLNLTGKLTSGKYRVPACVSSQYITGLLLALPLLDGDSEIILEGETVSAPYIDITLDVLGLFGGKITRTASGFWVKGQGRYTEPARIDAEGDWSNAAFFLVAGAIGGKIAVKGLSIDSRQGDKAVAAILQEMGAKILIEGGTVTANAAPLRGIKIDARDIPDLVPVLSVAALHAEGETVFLGVSRLKDKESDRLSGVIRMVQTLGGEAFIQDGSLVVKKGAPAGDARIFADNDHRMAMAAAIAASCHNGRVTIDGSGCVEKSYPAFFEDYNKLGGKADVILT